MTTTFFQSPNPSSIERSRALAVTPGVTTPATGVKAQVLLDQIAAQKQRLDEQEKAIGFLAGLVAQLQGEMKQLQALPSGQTHGSAPTMVDMAREIEHTIYNKKHYWSVKTSRYAKHGAALWPDPETLEALGVTLDWLKGLSLEEATPFARKVRIAVNADGKKPKVIGFA